MIEFENTKNTVPIVTQTDIIFLWYKIAEQNDNIVKNSINSNKR